MLHPFVRKNGDAPRVRPCNLRRQMRGLHFENRTRKMNSFARMEEARLNLSTGRLSLKWRPAKEPDNWRPKDLVSAVHDLGYRAAPFDPAAAAQDYDNEGKRLLRAMGVAGFAMANVMLLSVSVWAGGNDMGAGTRGLMHWASAIIAIPAALYAGQPFFSSAWGALKNRHANMDVPISLAVILALSISIYEFFEGGAHTYFDAAVMLLFFLLIGRYLDHRLRWRARAAARDLLAQQATVASRLDVDGAVEAISVGDVEVGDRLLLLPGDRVPVDGEVVEGTSHADFSLVTGESAPTKLRIGDRVHSGVVNLSARLIMRASAPVEKSLLADLAKLIETGEQSRSRYVKTRRSRGAALCAGGAHACAGHFFWVAAGWWRRACWAYQCDRGTDYHVPLCAWVSGARGAGGGNRAFIQTRYFGEIRRRARAPC